MDGKDIEHDTVTRLVVTAYFKEGKYIVHESEWGIYPMEAVATPGIRKQFREAVMKELFHEGIEADDDGKSMTERQLDGSVIRKAARTSRL